MENYVFDVLCCAFFQTAIESALSMNDQAVIYDVTNLMLNKT